MNSAAHEQIMRGLSSGSSRGSDFVPVNHSVNKSVKLFAHCNFFKRFLSVFSTFTNKFGSIRGYLIYCKSVRVEPHYFPFMLSVIPVDFPSSNPFWSCLPSPPPSHVFPPLHHAAPGCAWLLSIPHPPSIL